LIPYPHWQRPPKDERFVARSEPNVLPQGYISRMESETACVNAGKRLCNVTEWHQACRGSRDTTYPYGPRFQAHLCNTGKTHLLSKFFGSNPNAWLYAEHFNNPSLNQLPGFLARTGEYAQCMSDYGVYDMVGNLHEWVADRVDSSLTNKIPMQGG